MRTPIAVLAMAALLPAGAAAQNSPNLDVASAMHWRSIGPVRAGRGRALAGVPAAAGRPAMLYVGFDNGGVWRTTDYGANWVPLFDHESTGAIGAIGVAASDPAVIYVGSGAGIIRPDLATGDGMYKSTDTGRTWTHLGDLADTRMIAMVDVDPTNPNRLFVAALGHPYGPSAERGIFRSTDGGRSFEKVLYRDEYTSANDVRIDPSNPQTVYAGLWPQQQAFWEGGDFTSGQGGIYKSTDGGTTWTQLTEGLPQVLEANLAIAPGKPNVIYAMVAAVPQGGPSVLGLYRSDDGGAHWTLRTRSRATPEGTAGAGATVDPRPLARIGGGDVPTIVVDPTNENVVYVASTVMWRTEDGGASWSAVRGAPGGDDYQRVWVSPADPALLLVVSDQGAVVSANRGLSWSNWYTQSTAAMYHTTTDNAYPYRVCGGQQDSGSLCVASRSDDGEITFHDWHPVNIQEYGMAAPDPRDPDVVFGSARTNVSRYDRRTGQTTLVGPDATARGDQFGRNVRTMPLIFSPLRPNVLFYASNAVWRSLDKGHSWTRISPDLTRQTWAVPPSAGRYAGTVTPSPRGAITALAPSPKSALVLWAGTDDGQIQMTTNGGATWSNVTPDQIAPWTRIFNLEAGHFDAQTAYAAANTLRIDDYRPHFWKTHDGGATWTEIDAGVNDGAVANSIREDPRQPGLLYAATDTQVWVSFDDGGSWQSLRLDMPAISVRDLVVKDDSTCGCADLVAGTHGRGYWILGDLTPLRQQAQVQTARAAGTPYLVKPLAAVRVRFGTNEPTPWPPEMPAGENPPAGAILDYYLPNDATGRMTLEVLDAAGKVVRTYASDDPVLDPDPALDRSAYDAVCRRNPAATDCGL
ncbi:MAG: glycoside hydrolase, partial [Gemmatimonadales bacterium]